MARQILLVAVIVTMTFNLMGQCGVSFTQTNNNCFGNCEGTAFANPTGASPFTYNWNTGDTTQFITNLCAGTYTLTLTDSLGCIATDSLTISEPSQLIATTTILSSPSATGACDAELTYSASGGTIPYVVQCMIVLMTP